MLLTRIAVSTCSENVGSKFVTEAKKGFVTQLDDFF